MLQEAKKSTISYSSGTVRKKRKEAGTSSFYLFLPSGVDKKESRQLTVYIMPFSHSRINVIRILSDQYFWLSFYICIIAL